MAVVPVIDYLSDEKSLRRVARRVADEELGGEWLLSWAVDLVDTLRAHNAYGLAATQIRAGERDIPRAFAIQLADRKVLVVVNPRAKFDARKEWGSEACLSFRSVKHLLAAPIAAEVSGVDERGSELTLRLRNVGARCAYHEIRHLDGLVMTDEMGASQREKFLRAVGKVRNSSSGPESGT